MNNNEILQQNKKSWEAMADEWFGKTSLPVYGPTTPTEDELKLFGNINGKNILDVGCGSGHSLKWCADHGANELHGLDISANQLLNAKKYLEKCGYSAKLYNQPMEERSNIPENYFDVVYSIYAIGWTTDLQTTFDNIAYYLKKNGVFIFSWDHPFMHCVDIVDNKLIFSGNYLEDEFFSFEKSGQPVSLYNRKMSSYVNALAKSGFVIEKMVEESSQDVISCPEEFSSNYYSPVKASRFPLSLIIKAKKV